MYIKLSVSENEKECIAAARKQKQIPPHCPQDSNLKYQASEKIVTIQELMTLLTVGLTSHSWPVYVYNCMQLAIQSIPWASAERFTIQSYKCPYLNGYCL